MPGCTLPVHPRLPEVPSSPQPRGHPWLVVGTAPALEKQVSREPVFPSCIPNQLALTCLPFSPQSSQPPPMMPASRARGGEGGKGEGKGPQPNGTLSHTHAPSAPSRPWQTSLINHRLPSHRAEAQLGTSALDSTHQSCAPEGSHFPRLLSPPGPQVRGPPSTSGHAFVQRHERKNQDTLRSGHEACQGPWDKAFQVALRRSREAGHQKALAGAGGISVTYTPVSPLERLSGSSRTGSWTLGPPGSWDAAQQAPSLPPPGGGMSRCG